MKFIVIKIKKLIEFSLLSRQKYEFKNNDIVAMVDEIMEKLKLQAEVKKLPLVFERPEKGFPKVFCDQERILDVIMNFIDNALKYTKKGSVTVTLKVEPPSSATPLAKASEVKQGFGGAGQNMITFSVKDTGMGIDKDTMPLLFKKFSRAEGSFVVHTEGTGLGLFVAKLIIGAHEGKIWAESPGEGKGSTFSFSIPIKGPKKLPYEAPDAKK